MFRSSARDSWTALDDVVIPQLRKLLGDRFPLEEEIIQISWDNDRMERTLYSVPVTSLQSGTVWRVLCHGGISNNLRVEARGRFRVAKKGSLWQLNVGDRMCSQPRVWHDETPRTGFRMEDHLARFYAAQVFGLWAAEDKLLAVGE
jgi:hypothetical protein